MTIPFMDILNGAIKTIVRLFDDAYKAGWMVYLILVLISFTIYVIWFN